MSLTTIKNAVAAKIAALTGSSDATEIGMLHNLATRLGLATTNTSSSATTKAGTATVSTDTADLALLTSVLNGPSGNSYVGELRRFGSVIPQDQMFYDGTRWLGLGKYESDVSRFDQNIWKDALTTNPSIGVASQTFTDYFHDVVILNSGKKACFRPSKAQIFSDPAGSYTTLSNASAVAFAYNSAADILFYTDGTYIYKSSNDGVTNSSTASESSWNPGVGYAATAQCMWFSGSRLWVGGRGYIRYTDDNGGTWNSYNVATLGATTYVCGLIYDPSTSKLYAITRSTPKNSYNSAAYSCWVSTASGSWTACTNSAAATNYNSGALRATYLVNNVPVYVTDYNANGSRSYFGLVTIHTATDTMLQSLSLASTSYGSSDSSTKILSCRANNRLVLVYEGGTDPIIATVDVSSSNFLASISGSSTIQGWNAMVVLGIDPVPALAMYYQDNKLFINVPSRGGVTKIPLAGNAPISGFSHIRIS